MRTFFDGRLSVEAGDLTALDADALVNAANSSLLGGGGVDGAIHRAGGPAILEECRRLRTEAYPDGLPAGRAVVTTGGRLKAAWVIHTVGPVWRGGGHGEDELLAEAYKNCLNLAEERGLGSVAFPAISTGVYGFPKARADAIVGKLLASFFRDPSRSIKVRLVFYSAADAELFIKTAAPLFGET